MTTVSLLDVSKSYEVDNTAVSNFNLTIQQGELMVLLGPSGCGKTTIMRLIAGLIQPTVGDIQFDGQSILATPPEKRGAVMVFQHDALFPFMSVADNVAFGLAVRHVSKAEMAQKVTDALAAVQLAGFEHKRPSELSGGQRQRVALARALVIQPKILLLDEPLSQLDPELRQELRQMIRRLQKQVGITTLFVTHDQEEAIAIADRIGLMINGRLHQVDVPEAFFKQPADVTTARFFGWGNLINGSKSGQLVETAFGTIQIEPSTLPDGDVLLSIRPEAIEIGRNSQNSFDFMVKKSEFLGQFKQLTLEANGVQLRVHTSPYTQILAGEICAFYLPCERICMLSN